MNSVKGRLLYVFEGKALLFSQMAFFLVDLTSGDKSLLCRMPVDWKIVLLSGSRILSRLKRLDPKCVGRLSKTEFVVSLLRCVWVVDIQNRSCEKISESPEGFSDTINFCSAQDGVYWGDYGRNPLLKDVSVYRLGPDRQVKVMYTFDAGTVRHVHNIVKDGAGFLLFVGDNEKKAGIYRVNHDWSEVIPYKTGEQRYRAVVGWPFVGGVLYATDSVETENHIRLIAADGEEKNLTSLNGSCIYGCETRDHFLFSTTVEPHEGDLVKTMLFDSLGAGIKSRDVTIVAVNKKNLAVRVIASYKKDRWPMKLFQYGRCIFAGGQNESVEVWCSPVACKKYDGTSIKLNI